MNEYDQVETKLVYKIGNQVVDSEYYNQDAEKSEIDAFMEKHRENVDFVSFQLSDYRHKELHEACKLTLEEYKEFSF